MPDDEIEEPPSLQTVEEQVDTALPTIVVNPVAVEVPEPHDHDGMHTPVEAATVVIKEGTHILDDDKETSALIAEAAAAAVEAASVDVDVTAVASAAALALEEATKAVNEAAATKKNEQRRKRYREKLEGKDEPKKAKVGHEEQLAARRMKDRQRYANMTAEQREVYNARRREQYHRQTEQSRQKRRERERSRYHSLTTDAAKERNARRAKLERERYQRLSTDELEAKNRRRRKRSAASRQKKDTDKMSKDSFEDGAKEQSDLAASPPGAVVPKVEDSLAAVEDTNAVIEEAVENAMEETEETVQLV